MDKELEVVSQVKFLKLDLGCGKNKIKEEGFTGVDAKSFDGVVDIVLDLVKLKAGVEDWRVSMQPNSDGYNLYEKWPWEDNSVEEVNASHILEHFTQNQRVFFINELYRVLMPGGKARITCPHCFSCRAYGDMTHQWPPVSEFYFYYLDKNWRDNNAPHNDFYICDFDVTYGYGLHQQVVVRNQEFQHFAVAFYKEAAQDISATLIKRAKKIV